jgi:hypothetical protein
LGFGKSFRVLKKLLDLGIMMDSGLNEIQVSVTVLGVEPVQFSGRRSKFERGFESDMKEFCSF